MTPSYIGFRKDWLAPGQSFYEHDRTEKAMSKDTATRPQPEVVPAIRNLTPATIYQLKAELERLEASRKPQVRRFVKQMLERYPFLNGVGQ